LLSHLCFIRHRRFVSGEATTTEDGDRSCQVAMGDKEAGCPRGQSVEEREVVFRFVRKKRCF
jgi:hypothetical protein